MQNCINHLIEDLKDAKQLAPEAPVFSKVYEEFEEQMLAIENAPDVSYEKLMGLTFEQFPPSTMLTEDQMLSLINALEDTFEAFEICIDLPEEVPMKLKYDLIRDFFKEKLHFMPGFTSHFNFCSGYCPDCEIASYCKSRIEDY